MSRTLLTGPAGTGKTERVLDEIRGLVADGPVEPFVVLVPTYSRAEHLKRRLLRGPRAAAGIFDRGIATFEQYAERRTARRLSGLAPAAVRDALLVEALAEAAVPDFADAARFPGFRRAALRVFKEVKGSDPGDAGVAGAAERLAAAGESLPGSRGRKLAGLARVLVVYQRRLERAGLLDHEDLLRALLAHLRTAPPEPLRLFAADGFTDLTEVQERIVQALVERADRSLVTLLADGEKDSDPFAASADLRRRLRTGSRLVEEALTTNRRARGDLVRLERLVAGDAIAPAPADGLIDGTVDGLIDGTVRFLAGADPDDEADRVARTCLRLATDDRIPRSEILVIVRSLRGETSARLLDALARHGVPARSIGSASLAASPVARSALRLFRLLAGADEPGDALAAVRAGDARGVAAEESDALDAEARRLGVRGAQALADLARGLGLATCVLWLEELRVQRLGDVRRPPADVAAALLEAADALRSPSFDAQGDDLRAAAGAAALRAVATLVSETARGLRAADRATIGAAEFVRRVADSIQDARFAPPDRRDDVVYVVDAEEARQWEARAVVVAGLRLGEWPGGAREDLFVADRDRAAVAKTTRVRLASRIDEALRRERLLFYAAVTRARERLVLTTSTTDARGDPALPSPFLEDAMKLFEDAVLEGAERSPGDVRPAARESFGAADLERTALAALTERFEPGTASERRAMTGLALFARLAERPEGRALVAETARWFRGPEAKLDPKGAARALMAAPRRRSASSLASFAQCAYRHFADKGLGLAELDRAADDGPDALLLGSIAHAVLERAVPDPAQAEEIFDAAWGEAAARFAPSLRLARDRATLRETVLRLVEEWRRAPLVPGFRPSHFELPFGMDGAPALTLAAPAGPRGESVEVAGRIDRVDLDDAGRAVVIDYKYSTSGRFARLGDKIAQGLDLQLPLYALAARARLGAEVVAAGYVTLRDGRSRWLHIAPGPLQPGRADVSWEGEGAQKLAEVELLVRQSDAKIRDGGIAVEPRDPQLCSWCSFADLCRHEGGA